MHSATSRRDLALLAVHFLSADLVSSDLCQHDRI